MENKIGKIMDRIENITGTPMPVEVEGVLRDALQEYKEPGHTLAKLLPPDLREYILTGECQSVLYDVDLLPEQVANIPNKTERSMNWKRMYVIARLLKKVKYLESEGEQ